ncbi:hypothetical protein [Nocardioides acrostichi]|uniref:Uncharacterized protein n=1 Tax=Nocardioides acrostichi TaxID=2784339 RepID=A0A930V1B3_9ACTN|nr:hypothetical protein [Nocardioides acrostichi]MBF4162224.1 hypothetical protein [Nocardioides acrostichi]
MADVEVKRVEVICGGTGFIAFVVSAATGGGVARGWIVGGFGAARCL